MTSYQNYPATSTDAVERYRYLLRTASPEQIEQAHAEAFATLSADERREVLRALARTDEAPTNDSPAALARSATRLEVRQPGAIERLFGNQSAGRSILTSLAAGFAGSAVYGLLFGRPGLFGFGRGWFGGGLFGHGWGGPPMGHGGRGFGMPGFGGGGPGGFGGGPGGFGGGRPGGP